MKRQTVYTLFVIAIILSFFVTPLGDFSKLMLNRIFSAAPTVITQENRGGISSYDWGLKDANWEFFSFKKSKGKVVFITFWASWHLPSKAQLKDIQLLYDTYKGNVDFYVITNEERAPVELFMMKNDYTFPVTYQIVGNLSPLTLLKPPGSYIIDKNGDIVVHQNAIADWRNDKVDELFAELIAQ
ncbi:TlpA family protein disulfide reductase [Maribacter antarcticus]|uniref:TlpA family protein disulfide reductase n=1 Tax=Maribacter antarcticus TaxID=505250 RepID=UPI0004790A8C|nr:TlpA disulfide reductase family protein [Maribacter antarcticus]